MIRIFGLALCGCLSWTPSMSAEKTSSPAKEKAVAAPKSQAPSKEDRALKDLADRLRKNLIDRLKDPDSARFKDEFISLPEEAGSPVLSLCGQVNSKNSYGGYTGFTAYIVTTEGMVVMDTHEVPTATSYLRPVWCGRPVLGL